MLCCKPASRRLDEGAAGRDDRPQPSGHSRLVSEQALQGQEEADYDQADGTTSSGETKNFPLFTLLPYYGGPFRPKLHGTQRRSHH